MPTNPPPSELSATETARQKLVLRIVITVLIVGAVLIVLLAKSVPLPLRLFVGATDLILAAVIWLLMRQRFRDK